MAKINPSPLGLLDLLSGALLWFTIAPIPAIMAQGHAGFLIFKGLIDIFPAPRMPLPVYVLGGAADVLSAAILFTGNPPVLAGYKEWIAGALFLKGVFTLMSFMQG